MKQIESPKRIQYPLVECSSHPGPQESYLVCQHVLSGSRAVHFLPSSATDIGELLCADCAVEPEIADVMVACAPCAQKFFPKETVH